MDGNGERISRIKQEKLDILGIPTQIYNQTGVAKVKPKVLFKWCLINNIVYRLT